MLSSEFCFPRPNFIIGSGAVIGKLTGIEIADYYVATNGLDSNPGTIGSPFLTIQKAHDVAVAGNLIYVRGGTYTLTATISITKSGTAGNLIRVFAYPGETPVIDGINLSGTAAGISVDGFDYWHFKSLEIKNTPRGGFELQNADNHIIERCVTHHCVDTAANGAGIMIGPDVGDTSAGNLVLNCDSHHNSYGIGGTGGDGISITYTQQAGNIIRGCRVWRNQDDGFDLWDAKNVLAEDNWSWENGRDDSLNPTSGNGAGFKLGGGGSGDGAHTIRRNLSWRNDEHGFDNNQANVGMTVYNNTSYDSYGGTGFAFETATVHTIRNNVAHSDATQMGSSTHDHNTWDSAVTLTDADFVSLDFTANTGARQSDGSLPTSNFMKLVSGSDLIDAGVDVGLSFLGAAPDMGAYEKA